MDSNLNKNENVSNSCTLLFDVGGTFLKALVADSAGNLIPESEFSVPMPSDGSRQEIVGALTTSVVRGADFAKQHGLRIAGLGIDFPGPFDYNAGIPRMDHKFQAVYGENLKALLQDMPEIGAEVPVMFMHDVNAALLGEMVYGKACGCANAALVTLGTGLGFACCLNGEIQTSELGSPRISIFKRPYMDGILEDYVSKRGFTRLYKQYSAEEADGITVAEIAAKAFAGDEAARKAFAEAGRILGEAIAPVLSENSIERLLLGGQISKSFELFAPTLREALKGVASLSVVDQAEHLTGAPFYGLMAAVR